MNLWVDFDLKFDPILEGENGQNKPIIHRIEKWPKSRSKVINSRNKNHRGHILGMFEL